MIIFLTILVVALSVYELIGMIKKKQKKEMIIFVILSLLTLGLGYFYLSNPFRESLAQSILKIFDKEF